MIICNGCNAEFKDKNNPDLINQMTAHYTYHVIMYGNTRMHNGSNNIILRNKVKTKCTWRHE